MKQSLYKTIPSLLAAPFIAFADAAWATPGIPQEQVNSKGTLTLPVENVVIADDGQTSFAINAAKLGFSKKLALLAARRTAMIIDPAQGTPSVCPYFNLRARDYTIREVAPELFRVSTKLSPEEASAVRQAGCAITTPPDRSKIEYLPG